MTRQDFMYKWLFYGLALLPVWWLELFVLNRFPLFGVSPMLLPRAAVAVAVSAPLTASAAMAVAAGTWHTERLTSKKGQT